MTLTSPGLTVGVVGGGQLGRMLGEAATPLGIELVVLDPTPDPPAAPAVRDTVTGEFDEESALEAIADRAEYLTYEIELADPDVLESVSERTDTPVYPHPETLRMIQDKLVQKRTLAEAGVPVPRFRAVDSKAQLREALTELGYPAMLKARTGGYDGRGNVPVESPDAIDEAFETIQGPALVEEFVEYERELAVIGCLGENSRATFPVTETIHREEILRETVSPPRCSEATRQRAQTVADSVLDVMDGRGVYGIELFETTDGEILFNEVAPRPHNSGHWTIEGCHTSQFEQHLRAITGKPLGTTRRRAPTASANILGDVDSSQRARLTGVDTVFETERANIHWYGKREVYPLRKMGHVTLADQTETPRTLLNTVRSVVAPLAFA